MYEPYWQLDTKPFEPCGDGPWYYPAERHQASLLKLRYAIESRRAGCVLAGPAGSGKTLIVEALKKQLDESIAPHVHLTFPQLPPDQLIGWLADELSGGVTIGQASTAEQNFRRISTALAENAKAGRQALVIIDEAQILDETQAWETLRLILNFTAGESPLLTLLLVGQPSLLSALVRQSELAERLGMTCLLRPFSRDETAAYVHHRLKAAGAKRTIFADQSLDTLFELSGGIPRRINRLGDLCLLVGFAEELPRIESPHVEAVCEELIALRDS